MEWLTAHWWQIATFLVSVPAIRVGRHFWTLQTKYDNAMEKISYQKGRIVELKEDVEYFKELRGFSDSSEPSDSTQPPTKIHSY